jgi:hypothetical protein
LNNPICRLLWWSLAASLVIYAIVAHVVQLPASPTIPTSLLTLVFAALSVAIGIGTLVYRRRALVDPIQSRALDPATPEGLRAAFRPFIINLALSESVGIYGLVLSFLSGQPLYAVTFSVGAIVLMYLHRPTASDLQSPMSAHRP